MRKGAFQRTKCRNGILDDNVGCCSTSDDVGLVNPGMLSIGATRFRIDC